MESATKQWVGQHGGDSLEGTSHKIHPNAQQLSEKDINSAGCAGGPVLGLELRASSFCIAFFIQRL